MASFSLNVFLVIFTLLAEGMSLPYRAFSSRSVPGRIRTSNGPETTKDYLQYYLNMVQQSNQQPYYGLPNYQPKYQQGYLSRRPQINPETIAALLPYISQTEANDYSWDNNGGVSSNSYTDGEGTWYDDAPAPEFIPNIDVRDKNNEQAALLELYLDHLAGKYSLEDLETLERQAVQEDNAENQLQSLLPQKKSAIPVFNFQTTARDIIGYPTRLGQKEESVDVPASSMRKSIFTRSQNANQKKKQLQAKVVGSTASTSQAEKSKTDKIASKNHSDESLIASTMEPNIKSVYNAFKTYLNQERAHRQNMDEERYHAPQKRFVADPKSLTQQLASLKKTIT